MKVYRFLQSPSISRPGGDYLGRPAAPGYLAVRRWAPRPGDCCDEHLRSADVLYEVGEVEASRSGLVVEVDGDRAAIDVGSDGGASHGQHVDVYRGEDLPGEACVASSDRVGVGQLWFALPGLSTVRLAWWAPDAAPIRAGDLVQVRRLRRAPP